MTAPAGEQAVLRRQGFGLEYASMAWMVAEAAVAVTAGVIASSVALVGFGLDSVIELFAAAIVVWQLRGEGQERQTRAVRLIGVTFARAAEPPVRPAEPRRRPASGEGGRGCGLSPPARGFPLRGARSQG